MLDTSDFIPSFSKLLSANDVGATASHQAGLFVPWRIAKLPFFPVLDSQILNPRKVMEFRSLNDGLPYSCNFIFYNNKLMGQGTRREYRLTGVRSALKSANAESGDTLVFGRLFSLNQYSFLLQKRITYGDSLSNLSTLNLNEDVLKLEGSWKVIGRWH